MSHLDAETIALRALGEHIGPEAEAHLGGCERCQAEVGALERVTLSARGGGVGALERPGEHVWDRIAAELELPQHGVTPPVHPAPQALATPAGTSPEEAASPGQATSPGGVASTAAPVAAGEPWWRRRTAWVAAASFLLGVGGTALALNLAGQEPEAPVVASAALDPLPGREVTGTAAVHEVDGRRVLNVELGDAGPSGYLEVWLLDADAQRLVSLGVLSGAEGSFELPPGLDIGEFPVVDVSDEPYDGDPAHSGDSIVRGKLA